MRTLLSCSLNDTNALRMVSASYAGISFSPIVPNDPGVRMVKIPVYLAFSGSMVNISRSRVEFQYSPTYKLPLVDQTQKYVLFSIKALNSPISIQLVVDPQLRLVITDGSWSLSSIAPNVSWDRTQIHKVAVEWNTTDQDSIKLFINNVRVNSVVSGGWQMPTFSENTKFYLGCEDSETNKYFAHGTINDIVITELDAFVPTPQPTPTPTPVPNPSPTPSPTPTPLPGTDKLSPIGVNTDYFRYYGADWFFLNCFSKAMPWISGTSTTWNDGRPLDLDQDGWPRSLLSGQRATSLVPKYSNGRYILTYEGQGSIVLEGVSIVSQAPNRIVFDVNSPDPYYRYTLHVIQTTSTNYLRNIRIVQQEHENTVGIFHPYTLSQLSQFRCLRLMNWMNINESYANVNWTTRTRSTFAFQGSQTGVAFEHIVDICNLLHVDLWLNIPHLASDDYIRSLASFIRDRLDPTLKLYVEYTNEVWNFGFPQANYMSQQGLALGLSGDSFQAGLFYYSMRSAQIFNLFQEVFGGLSRIVRVVGSQSANSWVSTQVLQFQGNHAYFDALAIAPYFGHGMGGGNNAQLVVANGIDWLFGQLQTNALPQTIQQIRDNKAIADHFNVKLIAYEGGPHLVLTPENHQNTSLHNIFLAANRDPRMGQLVSSLLSGWKTSGGREFMYYSYVYPPSVFGYWGSLEVQNQATGSAPKFSAVSDFIRNNPKWW